jgi:hypothetical protein
MLRGVLIPVIDNHPDGPFAGLWRIWGCSLRHGSILSGIGAFGKPSAVHYVALLKLGMGSRTPPENTASSRDHGIRRR